MAEVQERQPATRGRGSGRAGRGGYSSRGGRTGGSRTTNGDAVDLPTALPMVSLDEQGEMGQLKKKYAANLGPLREMFPDWTDDDFVLALQETDGDLPRTIERISEGNVSQFSDVKKKTKEKSRVRKETSATPDTSASATRGRGRGGHESSRGSRGRGIERGGRSRGRTGRDSTSAAPSGSRSTTTGGESVPTTEATVWGGQVEDVPSSTSIVDESVGVQNTATTSEDSRPSKPVTTAAPTVTDSKNSLIPEGTKKSWASMLAQPKPVPVVPKTHAPPVEPASKAPAITELPAEMATGSEEPALNIEDMTADLSPENAADAVDVATPELAKQTIAPTSAAVDDAVDLTPPRDQLTEDNLEHLPDSSVHPSTDTVLSTQDPGSVTGSTTTYGSSQQLSAEARPPMGGYATSAWKATGVPGRSASYQRRIMEQREAVVMPTNQSAVDRAAVQFGSMGLNGDTKPLDVDDDREEAQTRAPVAQSPPSQPRTSLPPPPLQPSVAPEVVPENVPTPKSAPGLPLSTQAPSTSISGPQSNPPAHTGQQPAQGTQNYGSYGRFGTSSIGQEPTAASAQKPYDPFAGQQLGYPPSHQESQSMYSATSQSQQAQSQQAAYSQGPNEYGSHYGVDQQRNNYQNYYGGGYGQQNATAQQDQSMAPQRSGSAFAAQESAYGTSQGSAHPGRFNERDNSGHNTPNPTPASQQQLAGQSQHVQSTHQGHGQGGHGGAYGYQNPYYGGSYYGNSFMNQYPNNFYNQQAYGPSYSGGKGNMYGQPHHGYGMSPQSSYEQSASQSSAGGFGSGVHSRGSGLNEGFGEYGRSGSTQPNQQQSTSSTAGYSSHLGDSYGRGAGGYSGQNQQYGQQQMDDSLKPYGDSKTGGPSPTMGQPGRTSSATGYGGNSQSQGYGGGYPNNLNQLQSSHGSAYGGIGGLGSHYGQNNYNYGRGGWGGNYGH